MNDDTSPVERDYKATLLLPQTDFPMKAGLPKREPDLLAHWEKIGLYDRLRADGQGREKYVLHDGPPYANGNLHIGHALNKILKDVVIRAQQMMGKDAAYVPGWDCHGLPIEWKIEEQYRKKGLDKDDVPQNEFRAQCRQFAQEWVGIQSEQFQRFGIMGDWKNPYTTMAFDAEATIVAEFQKFVMDGGLYRGSKPVMWSVVEKTALAEAEVEYEEHLSPTIFVKFPVETPIISAYSDSPINKELLDLLCSASIVIWTTTPWTIPANRAIAFSENLNYGLYKTDDEHLIICDDLVEQVMAAAGIEEENCNRVCDVPNLEGWICNHPLHEQGYDFDVPILAADFVTAETGTGLVHIAPGHGMDDFTLYKNHPLTHHIEIPQIVDEAGVYYDHVPLFAGKCVYDQKGKMGDATGAVIGALFDAGALLAKGKLRHPYPHSWRSKAPLIFRNTTQWFISMEANNLRAKTLNELEKVRFVPAAGRNRIKAMIENRPDWVISRQRAWGVPLTVFTHKTTGDILRDADVNQRIVDAVKTQGADAWFDTDPQVFLGEKYAAQDYEQVTDVLDVWFDSGTTHAFVLENRDDLSAPADLYLEGSDQHRGWFQSSLLESVGTRNRAPYKAVLTHGFVMDDKGRKMSKSAGNVVDPQKIIAQSGADIIRLWVASSDYSEDMRIGQEIIKSNTDAYRKMRNTLRFMLGNLAGFDARDRVALSDMPEVEQLMLHRLYELDKSVRQAYQDFDFRNIYQSLFDFMTQDLSAFYFDIRKDALYCDAKSSLTRRASLTVLDDIFSCLTAWLAPILCFTMEEVWQNRFPDEKDSVHLRQFPDISPAWENAALSAKWDKIRAVRRVVTGALEIERREKRIGSSLEAAPKVYIENAELFALITAQNMADICITSQIEIIAGAPPADAFTLDDGASELGAIGVVPALAQGKKCHRSWKILPDVGANPDYPDLSPRDAAAVAEYDANAPA